LVLKLKYTLNIFLVLITVVFSSCKKEQEYLQDFMVVGKSAEGLSRYPINEIVSPPDRCTDGDYYALNFDGDTTTDFEFYVNYCYSPCYYYGEITLNAKQSNCKILACDTVMSPQIVVSGDTLNQHKNWVSANMNLCGRSTSCSPPGSGGSYGIWLDQSDKYIGLMVEKDGFVIYAWVKVTVVSYQQLKIIEIAQLKASY
jgi:hypothetical protein